ncbi:uncharacterized protein LOC127703077 isoform X3 [Mytilus californianus]|uniref:uncharacterized protein LOC127703077 isoform X3 n=1 Tax=Mytilus californianus TaxID=6549 RepID=UPI002245F2B5|nr:uncharacterized protein LOC127703077 isoform X3 [Mytilus californianus]XP_052063432.1 uncharacterized protein LOC127703077 isoform X3 [Mytilus californianus]XP_052063433.1 uncharacterized protein LOC127703077 isoform X3 [Mytilus californianus]
MSAAPVNSPVSPPLVIQGFGNQPVQTGGIQQQEFPVGRLKVFGGIQIGLGVALGILSLVGVIVDAIAMGKYKDCLHGGGLYSYNDPVYNENVMVSSYRFCSRYSHVLLGFDITCLICSGWYILTGLLPFCMTRQRESNWRCLKISFMVCSIIGASVFIPTMFGLAVIGAALRDLHEPKVVVTSALLAVLSFAEFVVAVIAASFCCCCSAWGTSNQPGVIFVNGTQPGLILNLQQTQLPMANAQPVVMTNGQTTTIVQNHRAHQYQVMNTNEPTGQQIQTVGGPHVLINSTQPDFSTNPPPYKQ